MDLIAINFENEVFNNLCGGFESMVQRPPTVDEAEEIYKLTLHLYSYFQDAPFYRLSNFFVISNALTYTGVELGMSDSKTRVTNWAGIFHYEEDYFFIHSIENSEGISLQINLLSSFVYTVPLFVRTKESNEFWEGFNELYKTVYPGKYQN